ncbi:4'-phosphopantetheinyl transferase superfamily protein [Flavobacterium davisii]|uniref:4'-phosphopantetheinyl transferase superfamily protein n=1 Tax=Flavobacterium columnare TaxID=996 RepID=A0A8G0KWV8_9FLAO|nr:4'-phosphopantetheinyl transferase superfamily protein [Flavobacterium davisii]QYS89919.1 4'-phosphopantetheinyl transferase superfamily protein [Flavobacterium davisii]
MTHIYYAYISEEYHENFLKNELVKFPTVFQEKIKEYRKWQDAQLSLSGRVLLLQGIQEVYNLDYSDKEVCYTKFNKPYFLNDSIHFNISHSGDIVICAIAKENEVGIDIEKISNIEIVDFEKQFTTNEWAKIINSNAREETFFEFWAQKEAVIKAHGYGLTIPLQSFEILDNKTIINEEIYHLKELKIDEEYKCFISTKQFSNTSIIKK